MKEMERVFREEEGNLRVMSWKSKEDWFSGRDSVSHSAHHKRPGQKKKMYIELLSGTVPLSNRG